MSAQLNWFRSHVTAPRDVPSPLLRALTTEWVQLNDGSTRASLRRWARRQPALSGLDSPGAILDAIDAADPDETDVLLLALLHLTQDGHRLAGRVLLQAMLPGLYRLAKTRAGLETDHEERLHTVIAASWDVMHDYPVDRLTATVAANLRWMTRTRAWGDPRRTLALVPVDDIVSAVDATAPAPIEPVGSGELDPDGDLAQVLRWAHDHGILSDDEVALIAQCYPCQRGRDGAYGFAAAAAQRGTSTAAIRQRASRTVRRLIAAARADLLASTAPCPVRLEASA